MGTGEGFVRPDENMMRQKNLTLSENFSLERPARAGSILANTAPTVRVSFCRSSIGYSSSLFAFLNRTAGGTTTTPKLKIQSHARQSDCRETNN